MFKLLPAKLLFEIGFLRTMAIRSSTVISVYCEAERLRRRYLDDKIALEDIVEGILEHCHDGPGFMLDVCEAQSAIVGSTTTFH